MERKLKILLAAVLCFLMIVSSSIAATIATSTTDNLFVRVEFEYVPSSWMPASVVAVFYRDGAAYTEKTLSASNEWQCYLQVEGGHTWKVELRFNQNENTLPEGIHLVTEYFPKSGNFDDNKNLTVKVRPEADPPAASAAAGSQVKKTFIDPNETVSITLHLDYSGPIPGAFFKLYKVADMSKDLKFTMKAPFTSVVTEPDKFLNPDSVWLAATADALRKTAESSKTAPIAQGITDREGKVTFSSDAMKPGIYLAFGDPQRIGEYTYSFKTSIITVPQQVDGMWKYHADAEVKRERVKNDVETYVTFEKIWEKDDNSTLRPTSIELIVKLDGKQIDRVTLTASNGWKTTRFYPGVGKWEVQEVTVPKGYIATYNIKTQENVCDVTVINSYQYTTPTPAPTKGNLPQTGMVWWPVILMACAGVLLFVVGLSIYVRGKKNGKS